LTASVTHLWRLLKWGRTLARHGALTGIEQDPLTPRPVRRLARIARFGARIPPTPDYAAALLAIGPAAIKLGQALSTRPDLVGERAAANLSLLQDDLPPAPFAAIKQTIESYGREVRLVFKHMPLEGHRNSLPAARAAYCAAEQDRFWQFHDAVFTAGNLSPPVFEQIASDLGLGLPKFQDCVASERSRAAVIKDIEAARLLRIESTPSFVVNGKVIKGALSFADFQRIVEQELNQRATSTN